MSALDRLRGSITPLPTPFTADGAAVDEAALRRLVEFQIAGGSHGVSCTGTTGEPTSLTLAERERVIRVVVETAAGRVPVLAGTGSNNTAESIALTRYAAASNLSLERVQHDARLFGGAGRGTLRINAFLKMGYSMRDCFRYLRAGRAARARRYPWMTLVGLPLTAIEKVLLSDRLICGLRMNGIIVATFQKPPKAPPGRPAPVA